MPIYIGKAETPGKRTGRGTVTGGLIGRLREHGNSIRQATNLNVADFHFTVVAMAVDLVAWGEAVLSRHFQPVWCSIISGFGIHAPGKGRGAQMRSMSHTAAWVCGEGAYAPFLLPARSRPPAEPACTT